MPDRFNMSDVMISYSRRDKPFVQAVERGISKTGRETWVDWDDIPPTVDWWEEIKAGIEAAHTFIFIISPNSIRSDICYQEIDHAVLHNKRIVPILFEEVTESADRAKMHPTLASHNWIYFRREDDKQVAFRTLIDALETDMRHVRQHTRLLVLANEWLENDRRNSLLLRGDDLQVAETWLRASYSKKPTPTDTQINFITASHEAAIRFRRNVLGSIIAALVLLLIVGAFAIFNLLRVQEEQTARATSDFNAQQAGLDAIEARETEVAARLAANIAETQEQIALNLQATAEAEQGTAEGAASTAQHLAGIANTQQIIANTESAIANAAQGTAQAEQAIAVAGQQTSQAEQATAESGQATSSVAQQTAEAAQANAINLQQTADAAAANAQVDADMASTRVAQAQAGANTASTQAAQSQTNASTQQAIASSLGESNNTTLLLQEAQRQVELDNQQLALHLALLAVNRPDRTQPLTSEDEDLFYSVIYSIGYGYEIPANNAYKIAYSPDGTHFISNSGNGNIQIRDADTQQIISQIITGSISPITHLTYSPDGSKIVSSSAAGTYIWDAVTIAITEQVL